jgi:AcrR family transcriptional regulator
LRDTLLALAQTAPSIEALSLRQLAAAAGVSAAAVYRHFDNKDALLFEVAAEGFDRLAERFNRACPASKPAHSARAARRRFDALALAYLDFAADNPRVWSLMFGASGGSYRGWFANQPAGASSRPSSFEALPRLLGELHQQGVLPRRPNDEDALFAWATIHGAAQLALGQVRAFQMTTAKLAPLLTARVVSALRDGV